MQCKIALNTALWKRKKNKQTQHLIFKLFYNKNTRLLSSFLFGCNWFPVPSTILLFRSSANIYSYFLSKLIIITFILHYSSNFYPNMTLRILQSLFHVCERYLTIQSHNADAFLTATVQLTHVRSDVFILQVCCTM